MKKIVACSLIVEDDFKNLLIIQKKVKKNSINLWQILQKDIKGKQTQEKTISKMVQRELNCVIFDLHPFKEYVMDEEKEEILIVYTGKLKERLTLHKDYAYYKWISKNELDQYEFIPEHKNILLDYFK